MVEKKQSTSDLDIVPELIKVTIGAGSDIQDNVQISQTAFPATVSGTAVPQAPATAVTLFAWDLDYGSSGMPLPAPTATAFGFNFQLQNAPATGWHVLTLDGFDNNGDYTPRHISFQVTL
jgi:hypothetical protein